MLDLYDLARGNPSDHHENGDHRVEMYAGVEQYAEDHSLASPGLVSPVFWGQHNG